MLDLCAQNICASGLNICVQEKTLQLQPRSNLQKVKGLKASYMHPIGVILYTVEHTVLLHRSGDVMESEDLRFMEQ